MRLFAIVNKRLFGLFTAFPHCNYLKIRGLKSYSLFCLIHDFFISQVIDGRIFLARHLLNIFPYAIMIAWFFERTEG